MAAKSNNFKIFCAVLIVLPSVIGIGGQTKRTVAAAPRKEAREAFDAFDFERLKINPNNLTRRDIEDLRRNFLPAVKSSVLAAGDYPARLVRIAAPIFRFHKNDKSEIVAFTHSAPIVFTWKETFISFSTEAMDLLSDDEISALIAHEIGHLYFAEELTAARDEKDDRSIRIIELKSDLVALHTLAKLKIKPSNLISAVKKLVAERDRLKINSFQAGSPSLDARERLFELYDSQKKIKAGKRFKH